MHEIDSPSRHLEGLPHRPAESWDVTALEGSLSAPPTETADIAYGVGQRFTLRGPAGVGQTTLELYAERGVVHFTNVAEGIQVTLVGQETPPTADA